MKSNSGLKRKITIIISVLLLVAILITSSVLFVMSLTTMNDLADQMAMQSVSGLQASVETMMDIINTSLLQVALDSDVRNFSDRSDLIDIFDRQEIFKRIYKIRSTSNYFEEMYLYYFESGEVLDFNKKTVLQQNIEDSKAKQFILESVDFYYGHKALKPLVYNGEKFTILLPASPIEQNPRALIILTINQEYFSTLMNTLNFDSQVNVYVLDANGSYIFGKNREINWNDFSDEPQGTLAEGEHYFAFKVSDKNHWRYIYEVPIDYFQKEINAAVLIFIALMIVITVFCAIAIKLTASKLFKPVGELIEENNKLSKMIDQLKKSNLRISDMHSDKVGISKKIAEYIDAHYADQQLSIEMIAKALHFSESHISKSFKSETKQSIKQYITLVRVEKAKNLLIQNNMKVNEVGRAVGYTNPQSFILSFKKHVGITPGEFRQR